MDMLGYIKKSPDVMLKNINDLEDSVAELATEILQQRSESVIIIASGSSYNAAEIIQPFMSKAMMLPVVIMTSEQFLFGRETYLPNPFYIVITQSGASTNTISAIQFMNELLLPYVTLTGDIKSKATKYSNKTVDYGVGNETIKFVTLGVATLVQFIFLLAVNFGDQKDTLKKEELTKQFKSFIDQYDEVIEKAESFVKENKLMLAQMDKVFICGSDVSKGTIREGSLKYQETLHVTALHYEIEEFLHGPDMQIDPTYSVFLIDNLEVNEKVTQIYTALGSVITKRFLITSSNKKGEGIINIPKSVIPELHGFLALPIFQVISAIMSKELETISPHFMTRKFREQIPIKVYNK